MLNTYFPSRWQFAPQECPTQKLHPSILREYDIRGIFDETLSICDASHIGTAFGFIVRQNGGKRVCIARDGRSHSPMLYEALSQGIRRAGLDIINIGLAPTPMLYFADRVLEADGSIMITGSHNPSEFNGFKMVLKHKPFFGKDIQNLGKLAVHEEFTPAAGWEMNVDLSSMYIETISALDFGRPLKVAWDPGNGATGDTIVKLLPRLPGQHVVINAAIDGTFPNHHPDPTVPKNLRQLQQIVQRESCDIGIAFDGDGDRIGIVDDKSEILWGDQILALLAEDIIATTPGATVIADVKASQCLFDHIEKRGGRPLMWKTGHSLIKSKMAETKAQIAGEMSGHIFFADRYYGFDDGLYAATRFMEMLSKREQKLSEIRKSIPELHSTPELRIDCPDSEKFAKLQAISEKVQNLSDDVNYIDGIRVNNEIGWWLLRASNTQPALVARCEAHTKEGLSTLKATVSRYLQSVGISPPPELHP